MSVFPSICGGFQKTSTNPISAMLIVKEVVEIQRIGMEGGTPISQ